MANLKIGTCSWNYESWVGLVYSKPSRSAAAYLQEYSRRFRTAEVDSWFYALPNRHDVLEYLSNVDDDFSFTVKVTEDISLTHKRNRGSKELIPNPGFLSPEIFAKYLDSIKPMLPQIDAIMLEFEYLSKDKMGSVGEFMKALDAFVDAVPSGLPLAVETRNKNYLTKEYFQFLQAKKLIHVFSEKIFMPHIYEVYENFGDYISGTSVMRLLGGDRKEIEEITKGKWNAIVDPKPDKDRIVGMSKDLLNKGAKLVININNHFEGSAPLTADFLADALG
jgi:uncharacterized protein YecE (DUF72 family)